LRPETPDDEVTATIVQQRKKVMHNQFMDDMEAHHKKLAAEEMELQRMALEKKDACYKEAKRICEQSKKDGKFFMSNLTTDFNGILITN